MVMILFVTPLALSRQSESPELELKLVFVARLGDEKDMASDVVVVGVFNESQLVTFTVVEH